ncbi:nucleoside triphosphate pyrophosphohydrolase [Candidatus Dependentiae bacterium]|nr:nucleoside triphosphate pyrophosphohydrolase [Candidatus Dependentiae bacterium]
MRVFKQNKLWRDKAITRLEESGSKIHTLDLADQEYDKQLRLKLVEEADEVLKAPSKSTLIEELADVLEVIKALCKAHAITLDTVSEAQEKKYRERGGFESKKFVVKAEHPEGSFGEKYCLADPEKYPEIEQY